MLGRLLRLFRYERVPWIDFVGGKDIGQYHYACFENHDMQVEVPRIIGLDSIRLFVATLDEMPL